MYAIRNVSIEGFWDSYSFDVGLDRDVTFFIGQNGTGKTTFINLLAAALTADFRTLDRMPFKKIVISLIPHTKEERPSITVTKSARKNKPFGTLNYTIVLGGDERKELQFSLDDTEEQMMLRRLRHDGETLDLFHRLRSGLILALESLVKVNWLSIHRMSPQSRPREARTFDSSIDQKIESLTNDLVKYFATLSKQKDDEMREFQEQIFVSLLKHDKRISLVDTSPLDRAAEYSDALEAIFKELHVQGDTRALLLTFMKQAELNKKKAIENNEANRMDIDEVVFRIGLYRIEEVVKNWETLQERLKAIFKQRDTFQAIADNLFQRKKMTFSESNEMVFVSRSEKKLTPQMLSSGEKQLLILMSEALLQREMPAIFIADEPELSLHVLWQEQLVASLRTLNPNAQIICATHSPDIVGPLADKAIDMESLVK